VKPHKKYEYWIVIGISGEMLFHTISSSAREATAKFLGLEKRPGEGTIEAWQRIAKKHEKRVQRMKELGFSVKKIYITLG